MKASTKMQFSSDERAKSRTVGGQVLAYPPKRGTLENPFRPSPYDFEEFIPWMCLQFQSSETAIVTRVYQEDYVKATIRRASSKSVKTGKTTYKLTESQAVLPKESIFMQRPVDDDMVQIKAYYNFHGQLQEVSIVGCPFDINNTIIQIICMAVPYHPTLYKLVISKGGLTATMLIEIGKLLPQSHLTDICLDDTNVPQKNYTVLLQSASRLKNLSLNRCRLGDETCKEIAASIDIGTPGGTLRTLELSSNGISDEGALAFANMLRHNRHLLHLNLSGNLITDKGAMGILNTLMEFPMRADEILEMKRNRLEFNRKKIAMYEQYLKESMIAKHWADPRIRSNSRSKSMRSTTGSTKLKPPVSKKISSKKNQTPAGSLASGGGLVYSHPELELKAREAVGEFHDAFDADHIVLKDKYLYCVGNMFLCSLNLAYNNFEYLSVKKINMVLEYQSEVRRPPGTTGLLRITFEGNCVPKYCDDYVHIEMLLQNAINNQLPKAAAGAIKKKAVQSAGPRKSTGTIASKT